MQTREKKEKGDPTLLFFPHQRKGAKKIESSLLTLYGRKEGKKGKVARKGGDGGAFLKIRVVHRGQVIFRGSFVLMPCFLRLSRGEGGKARGGTKKLFGEGAEMDMARDTE